MKCETTDICDPEIDCRLTNQITETTPYSEIGEGSFISSRWWCQYVALGPELKQENRGETKHLLFGGLFRMALRSRNETEN
jgi:hypothetical protein